jgi:polyphenol oxidase
VKLPPPFETAGEQIAIELPGARALFTTRRGGFSAGPYESLNLGILTDDDPAVVARNREHVRADLGVAFSYVRQVHGNDVVVVDSIPDARPPFVEADGQATALAGVAPIVLTADCLAVAIAGEGAVAMLHAGWRGLEAGVLDAGVGALRLLGVGSRLVAAIGPGAGRCCYEVGDEVRDAFASYGDGVRNGRNLDLKAIAAAQLERAGVAEVHDCGLCTICSDQSLFFSHRRDRGVTGRQAGIAWRT